MYETYNTENYLSTPWRRIGGADVLLQSFLTSAVDKGEYSTSSPGGFNPRKDPTIPYVVRSVGPKTSVDVVEKRNLMSLPEFEIQAFHPVA
jgi:hypothetical protein